MSKTSLVEKESIIETIASLQDISSDIDIEAGNWDGFEAADWERIFAGKNPPEIEEHAHCDCCCGHEHHHDEHHHHHQNNHNGHEGFEGISILSARAFDEKALEDTIKMLSSGEFGDIPRAKGIVAAEGGASMEFDYVNGDLEIRHRETQAERAFVSFIGTGIRKERLQQLF